MKRAVTSEGAARSVIQGSRSTGGPGVGRARTSTLRRRERRAFWYCVVPALTLYVGLIILPLVAELPLAFSNWNGVSAISTIHFNGVTNFKLLVHDPQFTAAVLHNLEFTAITGVTTLVLALGMALFLEQTNLFRNFLRTVLFLPAVLPIVVVAFIWEWIYAPSIGILNSFLDDIGLRSLTTAWIGNAHTAFGAIMVVQDWTSVPFFMVIVLAGLQTVPAELEEAAELDGAHYGHRLRYVVIPHLRPVLAVVGALLLFWGFQQFLNVYVMTAGGPGFYSTQVLAVYIYQLAFLYDRFGYAAAIAVVLLVITMVTGIVYFHATRLGRSNDGGDDRVVRPAGAFGGGEGT